MSIACATPGVTIRVTTDGSTPSATHGTVYTGPLTLTNTTTLQAIAYMTGMADSQLASGVYTITHYHPADLNQDGNISIDELTAYAAAWQTGTSWPAAPAQISIDYLTCACMLWYSGGFYHYDSTQPAPLCWVSGKGGLSDKRIITVNASSALSSVTAAHSKGGIQQVVTLTITPAKGSTAYAVAETIPSGWTVVAHDTLCKMNKKTGQLLWGPFFDNKPRTLSYSLAPSGKAISSHALSGVVSVNGKSIAITGVRKLGG